MLSPKDQHFQQDRAGLDPLELRLLPVKKTKCPLENIFLVTKGHGLVLDKRRSRFSLVLDHRDSSVRFFSVLMVACVWVRFCLSWDSKKLCRVFTHNEIGIIETPTLDDPFGHSNLNTNTKPDFYLRRIVLVDLPFAFNETLLTSLVIPVYR